MRYLVLCIAVIVVWPCSAEWGGGFGIYQRLPMFDTGELLDPNVMIEPYLTYILNETVSIDFCAGIASLRRVPIFEPYNPTGDERISGDHKNVAVIVNAGGTVVEFSTGLGYTKRVHTDSYIEYGSIPYEVREQDVTGGLMVIGGLTINPLQFMHLAAQIRYHSKDEAWFCLGGGIGF